MPPTSRSSAPLAILHTESSVGWGGQEIRILTEAASMIARGHRVRLVAPPDTEIAAAAPRYGVPIAAVPIARKNLCGFTHVRRWLAEHGAAFDVINTHSSTDSWLAALARATLRGLPPIVRTRHVSTPVHHDFATRWLYMRATAHVVVTGEALRQQLHRDNGFPLSHMTSVATGIDLTRFTPRGDRHETRARLGLPDRPTIGIVATLRDWKGHDYLLEAFASLKERFPDWQLAVIGDGPRRAHVESLAARLRIAPRVHFPGNRDDVPDWLNALDIFALPSYGDEGVPQGIVQAMACGLPVVSTPIGAISEAVVDGETGMLVPPRDVSALALALARFMGDGALRRSYGEAGVVRARAGFGIDIMADRMEAVFARYGRRSN